MELQRRCGTQILSLVGGFIFGGVAVGIQMVSYCNVGGYLDAGLPWSLTVMYGKNPIKFGYQEPCPFGFKVNIKCWAYTGSIVSPLPAI